MSKDLVYISHPNDYYGLCRKLHRGPHGFKKCFPKEKLEVLCIKEGSLLPFPVPGSQGKGPILFVSKCHLIVPSRPFSVHEKK